MSCATQADITRVTPWGRPQVATAYAPGIVLYSTASHGGFYLSEHRQQHVESLLPEFATFAGGPWYEEDCDACLIPLVWPEYFTDGMVANCRQSCLAMASRKSPWDVLTKAKWRHAAEVLGLRGPAMFTNP